MADRQGQAATASNQAEPISKLPVHSTNDVTVEYIKENDFGPQIVKKYSPRSLGRPKRTTGKGYYVTHESESFVRKVVEKAAAATQKKDPERTQSTRTRRSVGGDVGTASNNSPKTPKNAKSNQQKEPQSKASTTSPNIQKESLNKSTSNEVDPPKSVVVPATSASIKADTPKPDTLKATSVSEHRASRAKSIQLPVAARAVTHKPAVTPKSQNLVADTISSIVSLFGERKKQQGGGSVASPAAARSPIPDSAKKTADPSPTVKRRVGRSAAASVTPPAKSLTTSQTNDVVKKAAAIPSDEVQIKSKISQPLLETPAATSTPESTGGRIARTKVGTASHTKNPFESTTKSALTLTPSRDLSSVELRNTLESRARIGNQAVKQTNANPTESLSAALSNVLKKTIGATASVEKKTGSRGRAAATAVTPTKEVENSADDEGAHTAIVPKDAGPSAPTGTIGTRRGRANAKSSSLVGVTVTPAKGADNLVHETDATAIVGKSNEEDPSNPATPTNCRKPQVRGNQNIPITEITSEGTLPVSFEKSEEKSSEGVTQKISTNNQIESTPPSVATTTTKRGRRKSTLAQTKIAVAEVATTPGKNIIDTDTKVVPETLVTKDDQLASPEAPSESVAKRHKGNSRKRKASPEKESSVEVKPSARSVNLAKRVAAKAGRGNSRKRARTTADIEGQNVPVEEEISSPAAQDVSPDEEVTPAATVDDAAVSKGKVGQALVMIEQTVRQAIGKQSELPPSTSAELEDNINNKLNKKSLPSELQQTPEEDVNEDVSSEEVTGKGTNAQKKKKTQKPVELVKTFPLRSRRRIESDSEEEEVGKEISDQGNENPEQTLEMEISVQKSTEAQSNVAETVKPAEDIGVHVKRKRGRPAGQKSKQGAGVPSTTNKQLVQSTPEASVVRKRRGRSAKKAGPNVPSEMTEDDGSMSIVSVDESLSVVSVDESISIVSVDESLGMASVDGSMSIASVESGEVEKTSFPDEKAVQEDKGRKTRRKTRQTIKGSGETLPLHSTPKLGVVRKRRGRSMKREALEVPSDLRADDEIISIASIESGEISANSETAIEKITVPEEGPSQETISGSQLEDSGGGGLIDQGVICIEDFSITDGGKTEADGLKNETGIIGPVLVEDTQMEVSPESSTHKQMEEPGLKQHLNSSQIPCATVVGVLPAPIQKGQGGMQNSSKPQQDASLDGFVTSDGNLSFGNAEENSISIRNNESEHLEDVSTTDIQDTVICPDDQGDQSSINSFSFRTPVEKGPSRKSKKRANDISGLEPPSKILCVEESPTMPVTESTRKRHMAQLAYEEKFGVKRVGKKAVCPDCGKHVGPFYLQRHRKSENCTPKKSGTDLQSGNLSVKTDTSLGSLEGTPKQSGISKAKTPKQTPKLTTPLRTPQTKTPSQDWTPCGKCGRVVKSQAAFHEKWCGLETVREECSNCQKQILVKMMESHLRNCSPPQPKSKEPEEPEVTEDGTERKGRRAAKRAMSNIHTIIQSMSKRESQLCETPKKPRFMDNSKNKPVTKYLRKKWERDLAEDGQIMCPLSLSVNHCGFVAESVDAMSSHYLICRHHKRALNCVQCDHVSTSNREAKRHARTHTWSDVDSEDEFSDESPIEDEDADPDVDFSDGSGSEKDTTPSRPARRITPARRIINDLRRRGLIPKKKRTSVGTSKKSVFAERLEMFQDALDWTLDWRQRNQPGELGAMASWAPRSNTWHHLSASEAAPYLPTAVSSPWFTYHARRSDRRQTNLGLFETINQPLTLLNVGGPVWALDWLPTPIGESCMQYLAVYCHRQHDKHHSVNKATSGMSSIQIWSCNTMHVSKLEEAPKLNLLLAQNDGAIWCLKWSPRRVWPQEEYTAEGRLPWLGTLAVSTSNGKVNIYSIPVPGSLPQGEDSSDLPVYKVNPVLTLELQSLDNKAAMLQNCRCLDWQYLGGCHRLLAGYAGGQVALYDLLASSPLLLTRGTRDKPDVLRPLVSFMAHGCPVTSLAFCQRRPTFFTTVSQDRQMKVWNIEHLEYPVNYVSKSEYTKVVWPLHWATIFAAADNCYCLENNALSMIDTGYFGIQNRPLTVHNGSIMDACYSEWLNTCLSVDSSGVVEAMYLPYLMLTHKHHKSFSSRRMVMFEVKTEPLHACECDQTEILPTSSGSTQRPTCPVCHRPLPVAVIPTADPANMGSMSADEEDGRQSPTLLSSVKKVMRSMEVTSMPARPRTVGEMMQKYALVYEDRSMNNLNTTKETRIRSAKDLRADFLLPPLASQHKAEWNPNLGSHLWVAVGGEAGLVRIAHFSAFGSKNEQDFVKKVFKEKDKDKQDGATTEPL